MHDFSMFCRFHLGRKPPGLVMVANNINKIVTDEYFFMNLVLENFLNMKLLSKSFFVMNFMTEMGNKILDFNRQEKLMLCVVRFTLYLLLLSFCDAYL